MTHYVGEEKALGKAGVLIATDVDTSAVDFEQKDGRNLARPRSSCWSSRTARPASSSATTRAST